MCDWISSIFRWHRWTLLLRMTQNFRSTQRYGRTSLHLLQPFLITCIIDSRFNTCVLPCQQNWLDFALTHIKCLNKTAKHIDIIRYETICLNWRVFKHPKGVVMQSTLPRNNFPLIVFFLSGWLPPQLHPIHTMRLGLELDSFDGHHYISTINPEGPLANHGLLRQEDELLEVRRAVVCGHLLWRVRCS